MPGFNEADVAADAMYSAFCSRKLSIVSFTQGTKSSMRRITARKASLSFRTNANYTLLTFPYFSYVRFKKSRYLLMKPIEKLTDEEADQLAIMFKSAPRLADANRLKNEFLTVIRSKFSAEGKQKPVDWLFAVEVMDLTEFHDCTNAYHNWLNEILNSMYAPRSNGFIEGCNNKTKVLKRVCFGMRNFLNIRNRILFCRA